MGCDNYSILVLGGYRQTLAVLRSLGDDYKLILGCPDARSFVTKSNKVSHTWCHPPLSDGNADRFFTGLDKLLQEHSEIQLIFPVGDTEILFLSEHADRLPDGVRCVMPAKDVVDASQHKTEMFHRVCELEIPTAAYKNVDDGRTSLLTTADEIGFPCIIKPESETCRVFGQKAFIALTREALTEKLAFETKPDAVPEDTIVQKYCVGGRRNIYFFAERGEVKASVEVAIDRTDQWDGTGYAVEGHSVNPDGQWTAHLHRLAKALNYHGAGCLQYLIDPETGRATFLEINARLGANFACALDCGLDLPLWWVRLFDSERETGTQDVTSTVNVKSRPSSAADFTYPIGRRYTWFYGDVLGFKKALSGGQLSKAQLLKWLASMAVANCRSSTHVTFRWSDPLPTLSVFGELLRSPVSRLFRGFRRPARSSAASGRPRVAAPMKKYVES